MLKTYHVFQVARILTKQSIKKAHMWIWAITIGNEIQQFSV